MNSLENMKKEDLLFFINCYNDYIVNFYEEHEEGMFPVCVAEFFDFEFQEILKNKKHTKEHIVNENTIEKLEKELQVHNFYSCVEYEVLQMIRLNFENLLKSNVVTIDKIKDIASDVLETEEFNMLLDNLIIEELEKIKE